MLNDILLFSDSPKHLSLSSIKDYIAANIHLKLPSVTEYFILNSEGDLYSFSKLIKKHLIGSSISIEQLILDGKLIRCDYVPDKADYTYIIELTENTISVTVSGKEFKGSLIEFSELYD